jgi:hypothetical protein
MNTINSEIYKNLEILPEDLQGWNGDSIFFNKIIMEIKPKLVIEVGSWKGLSAINMAKTIKENKLSSKIYCVDTWLGALEFWDDLYDTPERDLLLKNGYPQIYYQFLSNVVHNNVQDIILPFPITSTIAYRFFSKKNISADVIYIDGSHEEQDVLIDIENYYKLLNDGGVIFGDDYFNFVGVANAVNTFVNKYNLRLETVENQFWIIRK